MTLKKNLQRFLTKYIPDVRFIYHKRNPLIMTVVKAAFLKHGMTILERIVVRRYYFNWGITMMKL